MSAQCATREVSESAWYHASYAGAAIPQPEQQKAGAIGLFCMQYKESADNTFFQAEGLISNGCSGFFATRYGMCDV